MAPTVTDAFRPQALRDRSRRGRARFAEYRRRPGVITSIHTEIDPARPDTVNVAARMQQDAAGGELIVAGGVADELVAQAPRCTLTLRGREQPMEAFVLTR